LLIAASVNFKVARNSFQHFYVDGQTDINIWPLMPDEDKKFGGSLVLEFLKVNDVT